MSSNTKFLFLYTMKEYSTLYYKLPILKWFFAIAVLFNIAGYSNYIHVQPKVITTELVITEESGNKKTLSYTKALNQNRKHNFLCSQNTSLQQLRISHTTLIHIKTKIYQGFDSSLDRLYIHTIYNSSYIDEDSFHFSIG